MKRERRTALREEARRAIRKIITEISNSSDELFAEFPDEERAFALEQMRAIVRRLP